MAKVCCSKPLRKHVSLVQEPPQVPPQSTSPTEITPKGIKTITCADTGNQLLLPHIKHVTTNAKIQIHVTSLNG